MSTDWIATPIDADLVRGAAELEPTEHGLLPHRLPAWARAQGADGQLASAEAQASGVRLVFRTRASAIELDTLRTRLGFHGMAPRAEGVYDLFVDGRLAAQASGTGGHLREIDPMAGTIETHPGPVGTVAFTGLGAGEKDVEIWLPHTEFTELVALRADAPVAPVGPDGRRVWVHHGSSISQGSNAASPATTWAALAAAAGGVELVNLGFSGSAMLDPFVARMMRDAPADLLSVKIGINMVNADLMRRRAFGPAVHGFLDTIRDGHPTTPLLVISPLLCPMHEDTPGPAAADFAGGAVRYFTTGDPAEVTELPTGKLTLRVIRAELARIVAERAATDPHLHHLDGRELYGEPDTAALPLPDGLHPDPATHRLMAQRFAERIFAASGAFAPG